MKVVKKGSDAMGFGSENWPRRKGPVFHKQELKADSPLETNERLFLIFQKAPNSNKKPTGSVKWQA